MSLLALSLLLFAASLHTTWNLLVKRATQKQIFTWLALCSGSSCALVFLLVASALTVSFSPQIWPFVICSATVEVVYYITLIRAYAVGDFSLIYPFARGTAPAFLFVWSSLFLGEPPQLGGVIGLLLIIVGLFTISAKTLLSLRRKLSWQESGLGLALATSFCISIYTVIDGAAVRTTAPAPYTIIVFALTAIFLTPFVIFNYSRREIVREWQINWWRIMVVGAMNVITYVLVLQAYAMSKVSYAGAIREISIVFAAFVGWKWLGEDFGTLRLVGAFSIFVGIVVIAVFG